MNARTLERKHSSTLIIVNYHSEHRPLCSKPEVPNLEYMYP